MRHATSAVQRALSLGLLLSALSGCALLGKGRPLEIRYFDLDADPTYQPPAQAPSLRLRLGTISAARHIERRFVSRRSMHEVSYYNEWRWTDEPDQFLKRVLYRNLFERGGVTRVVSGLAPTLEVELLSFEQLPDGKHVRVAALALMHDDRVQLWQRTFQIETALGSGDEAEALADALSKALAKVAAEITGQTLASLAPAARSETPAATTETPLPARSAEEPALATP